jgi:hypothetical protein
MCTASKSPRRVAAVAMAVGKRTLPRYGHRFSRHDYVLAQLFACLVLRQFFRTDYRGIVEILEDWSELRDILELQKEKKRKLPHFTTLQKAEQRLCTDLLIRKLLTQTVALFHRHELPGADAEPEAYVVELAAADSTGFVLQRASRYYICRRSRAPDLWQTTTYRSFAKLGVIVDCDTHLILAIHCGMGPRPDVDELKPLLEGMCFNAVPERLVADGGYDSQHNHRLLREVYGVESLIPAVIGRPSNTLPADPWRWLMATDFDEETYGQRWQVETVMFMLKCHQGSALTARTEVTRRSEMALMAVTHNILIVRPEELFYKACQDDFSVSFRWRPRGRMGRAGMGGSVRQRVDRHQFIGEDDRGTRNGESEAIGLDVHVRVHIAFGFCGGDDQIAAVGGRLGVDPLQEVLAEDDGHIAGLEEQLASLEGLYSAGPDGRFHLRVIAQ